MTIQSPNKKKNNSNNNKVKSKPLELYELAGKKLISGITTSWWEHLVVQMG
jgi:hypothetical protein